MENVPDSRLENKWGLLPIQVGYTSSKLKIELCNEVMYMGVVTENFPLEGATFLTGVF